MEQNRIKILPAASAGVSPSIPPSEVPIGNGSRHLSDLEFTPHEHRGNQQPLVCEVIMLQSIYKKVVDHLSQETTREHGGFLLGYETYIGDSKTPAVAIIDSVAAKFTEGTPVQLTFTTNAWRDLDDEIIKRYGEGDRGPQRVGWYHSHPNIRIFLSRWDLDVCKTYERRQFPVALVVDPVNNHGGLFIGGAGGYHPQTPQGFREAHDITKDSIVTWTNLESVNGKILSVPVHRANPNEPAKSEHFTITRGTVKQQQGTIRRQIAIVTAGMLMAAAIAYLYAIQSSESHEVAALQSEMQTLKQNIVARALAPVPDSKINVTPEEKELSASQQIAFRAEVTGIEDTRVSWKIDPPLGTISPTGVYQAPSKINGPSLVRVVAISVTDQAKFASAQIRLKPATVSEISVSINTTKVQLKPSEHYRFRAEISGSPHDQKVGVKWTIDPPDKGSIKRDGTYVAPASVSSTLTVVVNATSIADPSKSAKATITLAQSTSSKDTATTADASGSGAGTDDKKSDPPAQEVPPLSLTSDKTALSDGESANLTASSDGTPEPVTWRLDPSDRGTITAEGQYSAPPQIQSTTTVTVIATSTKNADRSGKISITLKPHTEATSDPSQ